MNELQKYFADGIDGLVDGVVLEVKKRIVSATEFAEFLSFVLTMGGRRIKALFVPEEMTEEEKSELVLSMETIPTMIDAEVMWAFRQLDALAQAKFIIAMRKTNDPSGKRFDAIIQMMKLSERETREQAAAEIARKAQEDADRARKDAAEKAESERQAAEAKRLSDEKTARENALREAKEQVEREAKFRQYVMREIFGTRDIVQLASRKLEKIKEFRGPNGITPEWQLAIIRDVAWSCEGELREHPSFLPTDKVELDSYIASLVQEAKGLQSTTSRVITGAYERQIELACRVLEDLNKGKVIHFPEGGRDGASDAASTEAAQKRAEREAKREERRERDRALRTAAKTPSQGGGKKH